MKNLYKHPAIIFFRTIETDTIKNIIKGFKFRHPFLDLGCGDGKITNYLFGKTFDYGLDNNEVGDVKIARKNKIFKKIFIEDATNISLKDNSVNFVFSNSVIEHIPNAQKVISEVSRILNKNGYFLMTVPTDGFKKHLFFSNPIYIYLRNKMLNHYHLYNHKKWGTILKKNKLKVVKYAYCITPNELRHWDKLAIFHKFGFNLQDSSVGRSLKVGRVASEKANCNLVILAKKI